jgi:hypothetical protein
MTVKHTNWNILLPFISCGFPMWRNFPLKGEDEQSAGSVGFMVSLPD